MTKTKGTENQDPSKVTNTPPQTLDILGPGAEILRLLGLHLPQPEEKSKSPSHKPPKHPGPRGRPEERPIGAPGTPIPDPHPRRAVQRPTSTEGIAFEKPPSGARHR